VACGCVFGVVGGNEVVHTEGVVQCEIGEEREEERDTHTRERERETRTLTNKQRHIQERETRTLTNKQRHTHTPHTHTLPLSCFACTNCCFRTASDLSATALISRECIL